MSRVKCHDCDAFLSKYRKPREILCAPCERKRIDQSLKHAHATPQKESRPRSAFSARWRGLEWETISNLTGYDSAKSAQSAARDYAKRNRLLLP